MSSADKEQSDVRVEIPGSVCHFEDPKTHVPMLGVIKSSAVKAKKQGAVYQVLDEKGKEHSVASKGIQIVFPPSRKIKPGTEPAQVLSDYLEVARCSPTEMGVDVDMLELSWEICASEDDQGYSAEQIILQIDEGLWGDPVKEYRAFRLLSSELGKVFFKVLHSGDYHLREYRPKTAASVAASKVNWCKDGPPAEAEEWCFI